jgi:uncharacterized protein (DUF427 family)
MISFGLIAFQLYAVSHRESGGSVAGCSGVHLTKEFTVAQQRGRVRVEDGHKRIRAYLGGEVIADSANVKMVWEKPYYPVYYFPTGDVRLDLLVDTGETYRSPSRGTATLSTVKAGGVEADKAARVWSDARIDEIDGYVSFRWGAMGHWFEEDEEVFVHARDPYTRVDALPSSRHVVVEVNGEKVADSHRTTLLFETGLPVRYYFPKTDVRLDLLTPSDASTACPYKGTAQYWDVTVNGETVPGIVWGYPAPLHESARIAGLVSFYNEKVDIYVDGELQERPKTVFS